MAPPSKRQRRSKTAAISLSAHRVLESDTPVLDRDIHGFITAALGPNYWSQYSEEEKRMLIDLFPVAYRNYNVDLEGRLECPVSVEFLRSDSFVKAGLARFKRDVKDGYWGAKWQNQARKAMQERNQGRFDDYLKGHVEEYFGEELGDEAEEDEHCSVTESDWEQEHKKTIAEEEEHSKQQQRVRPNGAPTAGKWGDDASMGFQSGAELPEERPEMEADTELRRAACLRRSGGAFW